MQSLWLKFPIIEKQAPFLSSKWPSHGFSMSEEVIPGLALGLQLGKQRPTAAEQQSCSEYHLFKGQKTCCVCKFQCHTEVERESSECISHLRASGGLWQSGAARPLG